VYLLTDLENYYERYDWKHIWSCHHMGEVVKMYEIDSGIEFITYEMEYNMR